jgi:NAD(P)-dependent dehydrogenase (short-subunit alcohol dehydrogenase family)
MRSLVGKTVALTGAASGIGQSLAVVLAARGARLALLDKDPDGLAVTQNLCAGHDVRAYVVDVSSREQLDRSARQVCDDFSVVDVLINADPVAATTGLAAPVAGVRRCALEGSVAIYCAAASRAAGSSTPAPAWAFRRAGNEPGSSIVTL